MVPRTRKIRKASPRSTRRSTLNTRRKRRALCWALLRRRCSEPRRFPLRPLGDRGGVCRTSVRRRVVLSSQHGAKCFRLSQIRILPPRQPHQIVAAYHQICARPWSDVACRKRCVARKNRNYCWSRQQIAAVTVLILGRAEYLLTAFAPLLGFRNRVRALLLKH